MKTLKSVSVIFLISLSILTFVISCTKKIDLPTVTTANVTDITKTTALSGGEVVNDGGSMIVARGTCWNNQKNPTTSNFNALAGGDTGPFSCALASLTPGTTYYVKAYAINSKGTAYGNEVLFTTNQIVVATLTTTQALAITSTTAISGGNITENGGGDITARGICWSTSTNPTTADSKTSDATGSGTFTSNLIGLLPGTTYHIRAYATNVAGTAYGNDLTFTTLAVVPTLTTTAASGITTTAAASGGNISTDGGSAVTARGVCWSTTTGPVATGSHTTDETGTGSFTSSITGLAPNTTYYIRAYATNSVGTAYGNEITFTTLAMIPTVTTTAASAITQTTATSGGIVTATGGSAVTARGVCWSTSPNPTISDSRTTDGSGTGTFTSSITGLNPGIQYYVRAYATNSVGTAYGNEITFTTNAVLLATVSTSPITSITSTYAVSGGNVTSAGGGTITDRGICWSTNVNPTIANFHVTAGTGTGVFAASLTGLTGNTIYYVRAYATNSAGTAYGNQLSFESGHIPPTVNTTAVSNITSTSATSGGNVVLQGGENVTVKGVCWNSTGNPTIADPHTTDGTGLGSFTSNITGLTPGITYYVRAYATNIIGLSYGNQITFTAYLSSLTDIDGNIYNIVRIGNQFWTKENLKTHTLNNGTPIVEVQANSYWSTCETPAWCNVNNVPSDYGYLYNWYAVQTEHLCPKGWHVPTDGDWQQMELSIGMDPIDVSRTGWRGPKQGMQLKATYGWSWGDFGTDDFEFTALGTGYRFATNGYFEHIGEQTGFWTSTEEDSNYAWRRDIGNNERGLYRGFTYKRNGFSVRCVKDN